jgi:hypothetical protein
VYDSGEHRLSGFAQQQGSDQSLTFTSQFGVVRVADLPLVSPTGDQARDSRQSASVTPPRTPGAIPPAAAPIAMPAAPLTTDDILKTIERLADLRQKNILTEEEFVAKKAELLRRL